MTQHWKQELLILATRYESQGVIYDLSSMNEFELYGLYNKLLDMQAEEEHKQRAFDND